ncbi:MAG TPA: hypothetical protein VGK73_21990, partial [Polyangiaceae bacterium]
MRALPPALGRYFRARRHAFALALLLVALPGLYSTAPPVANLPGLAQLLEHAAGVHTAPGDIAWEPRRGVFAELARGRSLLFLGAAAPGGARDLYRAWVRLTPGGQPLSVRRVVRLTDTPLADECGLTSSGTHAAFVTVSEQRARSVTLLGGLDGGHSSSLVERLFALGEQGTFTPLARTDLLLEKPAARVGVTLDARTLKLAIDEPARDVLYDLERRTLGTGAREVRLLERRHSGESAGVALLDLARSELGSTFVQGAGRAYYAAGRTIRGIFGAARGDAGEQRWQALSRPWLGTPAGVDRTRGTPEPLFQKRVLRPQRRADARLVLVDLDLRQV